MGMILDGKLVCTWQFFVTFFGWLSDLLNPLKGVKRPPPIGDEKVTTFESFGLNMPFAPHGSYWIVISEAPRSLYPIHLPGGGNSPIFTNIFFQKKGLLQPPTRFLIPKLSNIHLPSNHQTFQVPKMEESSPI